jgi:hypothetical protein
MDAPRSIQVLIRRTFDEAHVTIRDLTAATIQRLVDAVTRLKGGGDAAQGRPRTAIHLGRARRACPRAYRVIM